MHTPVRVGPGTQVGICFTHFQVFNEAENGRSEQNCLWDKTRFLLTGILTSLREVALSTAEKLPPASAADLQAPAA